jgi:hypothetical protein
VIGPIHSYLAVETTSVSDSGNTMVVLVVTLLLVVAGAALSALGYWYWKSTIPDPESLGPLHSMSSRSFSSLDEVEQRRALDSLRPSLAGVLADPDVVPGRTASEVDAVVAEPASRVAPVPVEAIAVPADPDPVAPSPTDVRREVVAFEFEDDDDVWPGDDWSDLDALESGEPEILSEVFHEEPRPRRSSSRREAPRDPRDVESAPAPSPIDPLIG